ncbi:MAG: amidase [Nocardioidaceae bacterium]|nr:amidase [Nocardioidaceae bacterium]
MSALWELTATEIATRVRGREVSAAAVVESFLDRIEHVEPAVRAYTTVAADQARRTARDLDARIAAGEETGPLAGVPVGVKDVLLTAGLRTTGGSLAYDDHVPAHDDPVVARIRAAGGIVLGKTTTYELAYGPGEGVVPQTRNPWSTALSPGGSSSGSAAAVASGTAAIAVGTDGGGSIRCPASWCGVLGLKPTRGLVPVTVDTALPGLSSWASLGHVGPIARTVEDAALLLAVIAGPDPLDPLSFPPSFPSFGGGGLDFLDGPRDLTGLRAVYSPDWGYAAVDAEVRQVVVDVVALLARELGLAVERRDPAWANPGPLMAPLIAGDSDLAGMRRLAERGRGLRTPSIRGLLEHPWTAEELATAALGRRAFAARMEEYLAGADLLLTPTVAVLPFPVDEDGPAGPGGAALDIVDWCPFTFAMNLTGQPAVTIPAGWTRDGLPVGLQVAGRRFDDALLLRVAAAVERALPWAHHRPELPTALPTPTRGA